ncbi:MAG: hypothetical protein SchgKO_19020 [Schleiferiaceae bacterium]
MRKATTPLLLFAACLLSLTSWSQTEKVLFIGNSYTGYNNLPNLTALVANGAGDTLIHDAHTPGGNTIQMHANNPAAIAKIYSNDWDHVVLQCQSQEPSFPLSQVQTQTFPYAASLCDTIRANNACTRPIFYMTWGRENGDASNCAAWPPVCTYEGMDSLLYQRYMQMGDDNEAYVSPVGAVWNFVRTNYPSWDLYTSDGSHPSQLGSYLAALSFYTIIFEKSPMNSVYNYNFSQDLADSARQAVEWVVYDSLPKWNVGEYDPVASFTWTSDRGGFPCPNDTVYFDSYSEYTDIHYWDFGNGDTASGSLTQAVYSMTGMYEVTLVVESCGKTDTISTNVPVFCAGVIEEGSFFEALELAPNPSKGRFRIRGKNAEVLEEVRVYDMSGREVGIWEPKGTEAEINIQEKGHYILWVRDDSNVVYKTTIQVL